jgi:hypothetical protein
MNTYDRELLSYLLAWLPFGGPSWDAVQAEFGIGRFRAIQIALKHVRCMNQLSHSDRELVGALSDYEGELLRLGNDVSGRASAIGA